MDGITFRIKHDKASVEKFAHLDIKAPDFDRVVKWGARKYDEREE